MSKLRVVVVSVAVVFGLVQLVPVDRENPPVTGALAASPKVLALLRRSCFDCHSNETRWPWYARIAPVSWLVARDVKEGREHLNFSEWAGLAPEKKRHKLEELWEEVEAGAMPPTQYLFVHGDAALGPQEIESLHEWALGAAQDRVDEEERGG